MASEHSWKWLPPEFKRGPVAAGRSRGCLPALEPLDDRLLLSAAAAGGDPGIIAVLIGLLRNEINVRGGELDALKIAAQGVNPTDKHFKDDVAFLKLQSEFAKLDGVLDKASVDAVNGGLTDKKVHEATDKINAVFTDIAKLLPELGGANADGKGLLLPAVQKVHDAVTGALDSAAKISKVKVDQKILEGFIKGENDLLKIDGEVLLYTALDFRLGSSSKATNEVKILIAASFDKLNTDIKLMGDGSVFKGLTDDLAALRLGTMNFLNGLPAVQTPGTPTITAFTGLSLDSLGDVITV